MRLPRRRRVTRRGVRRRPAAQYLTHKEAARTAISARVEAWADAHGFAYGRIAIRDTRRSWGSCSSKKNLNFNYKLLFLPPCLSEYIIVHELCHLRQLNHSAAFWSEVEQIMPGARSRAVTLRQIEKTVGTRPEALRQLALQHQHCPDCVGLQQHRTTILVPPQGEGGEGAVR